MEMFGEALGRWCWGKGGLVFFLEGGWLAGWLGGFAELSTFSPIEGVGGVFKWQKTL